nr:heterodisulfide reductase-related iron-sulfur binding cluster [Candidatus Sigynarchaeota archaeon]
RAYIQVPCQAFPDRKDRLDIADGLVPLLSALGFENARVKNDVGCCGAAILDTHPDFALEFGVKRFLNLVENGSNKIGTIFIGCGNCFRIYSDFKPSMDVEFDQAGDVDIEIQFLLHLISSRVS